MECTVKFFYYNYFLLIMATSTEIAKSLKDFFDKEEPLSDDNIDYLFRTVAVVDKPWHDFPYPVGRAYDVICRSYLEVSQRGQHPRAEFIPAVKTLYVLLSVGED